MSVKQDSFVKSKESRNPKPHVSFGFDDKNNIEPKDGVENLESNFEKNINNLSKKIDLNQHEFKK